MDWEDIVYVGLLCFSIGFGKAFRTIQNELARKMVSTSVGIAVVLITSGKSTFHPLMLTLANALVIQWLSPRIVHIASFTLSFLYLAFFRTSIYFGVPYPNGHVNLVQMIMTLKLVGLAFEVRDAAEGVKQGKNDAEFNYKKIEKPSILDVFHYSFCYIGVLTGPYYTYRTYKDTMTSPLSKYANCEKHTLRRLLVVPLLAAIHLLLNYYFPYEYILTEEFYSETSILFRIWYTIPIFGQYRTRLYIGMRLSEAVCIMAGLGAYPVATKPKNTRGPTTELHQIRQLREDPKKAKSAEYSFVTVYSLEPYESDFNLTMRESMKWWNMTVQYWLAAYVYSRFPIKRYRLIFTFVVSSFWHGLYAGYYLTLMSVPLYLPVESRFSARLKLIQLNPMLDRIARTFLYVLKVTLQSYWAIHFRLLTLPLGLRYMSSVYFIPHILPYVAYCLSFLIWSKQRKGHEGRPRAQLKGE